MVNARAVKIKLVLFDVDGVLTDGKILMHGDGTESKQFDIKDGSAMVAITVLLAVSITETESEPEFAT